jgi:hypothetical protein
MRNKNLIVLGILLTTVGCASKPPISIGTINYSKHYVEKDYYYEGDHQGVYIRVDHITVGTYKNSYRDRSFFAGYGDDIGSLGPVDFRWNLGGVSGYRDHSSWDHEVMPWGYVDAQLGFFNIMITPGAVAVGLIYDFEE